jgi:hypothetical protein
MANVVQLKAQRRKHLSIERHEELIDICMLASICDFIG